MLFRSTRNNTRALRSAAFHQVRESFSEVSLVMMQHPTIAGSLRRVLSDEPDVSEEDIFRYTYFLTTFVRRGESAYFQSSDGALQLESWLGIKETVINVLDNEHGRQWWQGNAKGRFTKDYTAAISEALAERANASKV